MSCPVVPFIYIKNTQKTLFFPSENVFINKSFYDMRYLEKFHSEKLWPKFHF